MPELPEQLRRHYEAQSLPEERVTAILAAGQRAAREPAPVSAHTRQPFPLLLSLVLSFATCLAFFFLVHHSAPTSSPRYTQAALQTEIARFFDSPACEVQHHDNNIAELRRWLLAQGAPAHFEIPPALQSLTGFGGHVLHVNGRPAYILCLWLNPPENLPAGPMMKKPMMSAPASDSTPSPAAPAAMMKKPATLVHLIITPRADLLDPQPLTSIPRQFQNGPWAFLHWSRADLAYTLATTAPAADLQPLLARSSRLDYLAEQLAAAGGPRLLHSL